jgi:hypothetical protein
MEEFRIVISFLCGKSIPKLKETDGLKMIAETKWDDKFPVQASWQGNEYRPLSLGIYNLSVACNVSLFSGWETEEFTLRLLRRRHGNKHFGVHIHDGRIAGFLSAELEERLSYQWAKFASLLPSFPAVKFSERLAAVKETDWYKNDVKERKQNVQDHGPIARYGEEDGVGVYLGFSALCLHLAGAENDPRVRSQLLQISLSVLLPIVS